MSVDFLLFGAHPDDVEWGVGGLALLLKDQTKAVAVVDLTDGEMGSRGTPDERRNEAHAASHLMGTSARESLHLPDGELVDAPATRKLVASTIRRYRPKVVLAPYWEDRHPDHVAAGLMVRNAALHCTLRKSDDLNPPHKPLAFFYYLLHNFSPPTFVVDISNIYSRKLELLRLHKSQFAKTATEQGLLSLGVPDYLFGLESRDRYFGSLIGVQHGEALVSEFPLKLSNTADLFGFLG